MSAPSATDPLGYDAALLLDDLDPTGRSASGPELYEAAVVHRLTCKQLPMIGSGIVDPVTGVEVIDFGLDVREWPGEPMDRADAANKATLIDEVLQRDPRTAKTAITIELEPEGVTMADGGMAALLIKLVLTTVTGEVLDRILAVNDISVEFLAAGR